MYVTRTEHTVMLYVSSHFTCALVIQPLLTERGITVLLEAREQTDRARRQRLSRRRVQDRARHPARTSQEISAIMP